MKKEKGGTGATALVGIGGAVEDLLLGEDGELTGLEGCVNYILGIYLILSAIFSLPFGGKQEMMWKAHPSGSQRSQRWRKSSTNRTDLQRVVA
jgi:hypothetical protein